MVHKFNILILSQIIQQTIQQSFAYSQKRDGKQQNKTKCQQEVKSAVDIWSFNGHWSSSYHQPLLFFIN